MWKLDDLTGRVFSRLTVLHRMENKGNSTVWRCLCECGLEKDVLGSGLRSGNTESCGCLQKERISEAKTTHGFSMDAINTGWGCWRHMVARCLKPGASGYDKYGAVGITVFHEWASKDTGFQAMIDYMGPRPTNKHSIDRFPNRRGNYEPGNVRWATRVEQGYNRDIPTDGSTSKYRGVSKGPNFETRKKGWVARLKFEDRTFNLGYFYTPEDAARAYNEKVLEVWGDEAILNIIEDLNNEDE